MKRSHQHDESETPRRKLPLQTAPTTGNDMHLAPDPHQPTSRTHANNKNENKNETNDDDDDATNDVYQTYQYQAQAF